MTRLFLPPIRLQCTISTNTLSFHSQWNPRPLSLKPCHPLPIQPPKCCVSHRWGEPFFDAMDCIEQMVKDFEYNFDEETDRKGGSMTQDTPIWTFAFANANNQQHILQDRIVDSRESGFTKAVEVTNFHTLSILDKDGVVLSRIWCFFEWYLSWMKIEEKNEKGELASDWNGVWTVYTALEHIYNEGGEDEELRRAVGIVPSGATSDWGVVSDTVARELNLPMECILEKALPTLPRLRLPMHPMMLIRGTS